MNDFKDSVMIALIPMTTDWCNIECPHMTLVYAGEKSDLSPGAFNDLAKDASSLALLTRPVTLKVTGVEVFGEEDKVNVLKLQPTPDLLAMRHSVEKWNKSEFPFRPHATIGPVQNYVYTTPPALAFDRIMVGWGEDQIIFWMRR